MTTKPATVAKPNEAAQFVGPSEISERLSLSRRTVYKYLETGVFPGRKVGNRWFVHWPTLTAYLSGVKRFVR